MKKTTSSLFFGDAIRQLNPSMVAQFNQEEKLKFNSHRDAYKYVIGKYGSGILSGIRFKDGEKLLSQWELKKVV